MPVNLKITWGSGGSSARMMGLADDLTLGHLKELIATKSGIEPARMQLKAGFPPKDVSGSETDPVVQLGITSGSAVTVLEREASTKPLEQTMVQSRAGKFIQTAPSASTLSTAEPPRASNTSTRSVPSTSTSPPVTPPRQSAPPEDMVQLLTDMGFPREYAARALEVAGGDINIALEICTDSDPSTFGDAEAGVEAAPTAMVRRIIDADNSCLFNAVGYALRRKRKVGSELRRMITEAVRGDPELYNEGMLGKLPEQYCAWISDPGSWGGEIELSILSKKLAVMITVVDIQTNNAYSYGEEDGHGRRVFVIYDGVHYDALAEAARNGAPEADDVTTFDPSASEKLDMAKAVAADLKARNQFTDMGNANLKCMVCLKLLVGEKGALEHARATTHQNFGQI